jgi:tRNA A37 threonylcarbamoyladenosine synthetase subunit TsaC/SUA5/YrdC
MLLEELGEPLLSSTLVLPGDDLPLNDGREIEERLGRQVDVILDAGHCGIEPTTVVDLAVQPPVVVRAGRGDLAPFA